MKQKPCQLCEKKVAHIYYKWQLSFRADFIPEENALVFRLVDVDEAGEDVVINELARMPMFYCPNCGRKLG